MFKLDPTGQETILFSFNQSNGQSPQGALLRDPNGNLYGSVAAGGSYFYFGGIFKLDTSGSEALYSFSGPDGANINGGSGLVLDSAGNTYGTTWHGGTGSCSNGCGVVFKLDPSGNETVLHSFVANGDGAFPSGLIMDAQGNLYGITFAGGANNLGTVFKIDGFGNESILYSFSSSDGQNPQGGIAIDPTGNLYGTTVNGGTYGHGTVFKLATVVDTTAPTIQCGSADDLWHPTDVIVNCTASDSESGLANPVDASFGLSTSVPVGSETADASTAILSVCDKAGNCATAGPISGIKVDKKPPTIALTTPANGATYFLNQSVDAAYACTDGGSGVASCAATVASGSAIYTGTAGSNSFQVNATDNVGNPSASSSTYRVQFEGTGTMCLGSPGHQILPPINLDSSSVFKQGSTVPAKFRVCDANGASIGTVGTVTSFALVQIVSGTASETVNEPVDSSTPDNQFRWDPTNQQWIFNISTQTLSPGSTYGFLITLKDGTTIGFGFGLR